MKTFRVAIWEETGGYVTIKAETADDAWDIAETTLDEQGIDGFTDFDVSHRHCQIIDCEEQ